MKLHGIKLCQVNILVTIQQFTYDHGLKIMLRGRPFFDLRRCIQNRTSNVLRDNLLSRMQLGKLLRHIPEVMGPEIRCAFTESIASVVEIPHLVGFDL